MLYFKEVLRPSEITYTKMSRLLVPNMILQLIRLSNVREARPLPTHGQKFDPESLYEPI